jgi:5-methylcytosine-specific restriction endonuclease McrA
MKNWKPYEIGNVVTDGMSENSKYTRFIDFPEEVKSLIRLIWPDGDHPKPNVLVNGAARQGKSIKQYLIGRINNPKLDGGKVPADRRAKIKAANQNKFKGIKHSEETKAKMRAAHLGKIISDDQRELSRKINTGKKMSPEAIAKTVAANLGRKRTPEARENLRKASDLRSGENSPNWKGGVWFYSKRKDRDGKEYKEWRSGVFARDNYTCQKTGTVGAKLEAHHICPFSNNEPLRFAVCNGITLSKEAHMEFHRKYGTRNNTLTQLEEWLGFKLKFTAQWMLEILSADDAYDYYQNMSDYDENGNYYWDE